MDIIQGERKKKLENLFSWSQFYTNNSLTVNRWPNELLKCKFNSTEWRLVNYRPLEDLIRNDRKKSNKIQDEIVKMSETSSKAVNNYKKN